MAKPAVKEVDRTLKNPETLAKYKAAGVIANAALAHVKSLAVEGAKIIDLTVAGDKFIVDELAKVYTEDSKIPKAVAFPTSVSPNNIVAHLSPLKTDKEAEITLKAGDVVKITLGAQIDGFGSVVADTIVIPTADGKVDSKAADAIAAAWNASQAAIGTIKPGNKNWDVTKIVDEVVKDFGCTALEGMLSHQQLHNNVEGDKEIILNPTESQKRNFKTQTFAENEIYGLDILVSSGEGKVRQGEIPTTIYRKGGITYQLKLQSSRNIYTEINKKAGAFPYTLRETADIRKARLGLKECVSHNLLIAYDVVEEKPDAVVAQFFTTFAITPEGTVILAGPTTPTLTSEKKVSSEETAKLIANPL
ncbi:uncharacterized protein SAPINGB_P004015 [Magnusiomyces paraingens]|uniref:Peptidase M24 domain-containing protein n=1 Tax=Magnusiomyces paraingens TaxID=2606893 RepID=A0A5E8BXS5_9ASCO|nr:uncharacterized protein SAPINGB_P004015 [Saprochaete ingens]VVT54317.1 unnamed protein product [Saprochaete ingens]